MKTRLYPFGYCLKDGQISRNSDETKTVAQIYEMYILGKSLNEIADTLKIPYGKDKPGWDKHRVKRILENKNYLGNEKYPQIIKAEDFDHVARLIASKRANKIVLTEESQAIKDRAYCHHCGKRIGRKLDRHKKECWYCYECYYGYRITDDMITSIITALLNSLIANPELAEHRKPKPYEPTDEIIRREQNITQSLYSETADVNEIIKNIMLNAEKKYEQCPYDDKSEITAEIKEFLNGHEPLKSFNLPLFESIVDEVMPNIDCSLYIKLKNGTIIKHSLKRGENND